LIYEGVLLVQERILTLHPEGKQGVNISKEKYDRIRQAILSVLDEQGEVFFKVLPAEVEKKLAGSFDGSISWYVTSVKLDLEARGVIQRVPKSSPQRLRLAS
jgi:hypothetical protein